MVKKLLLDYRGEFDDDTCFTSFEEELADIENLYAKPGKAKLIAIAGDTGDIAGCVAYQPFAPGIVEMKRLYVAPPHRGHQVGRLLAEAIISLALKNGFEHIYLDTMPVMKAAQSLYAQLGFRIIPPYNGQEHNGMICYGLDLNTYRQ